MVSVAEVFANHFVAVADNEDDAVDEAFEGVELVFHDGAVGDGKQGLGTGEGEGVGAGGFACGHDNSFHVYVLF